MPQYVISYLGGDKPSSPEEGKQHFSRYQQWLASMGDTCISPMNPFRETVTINSDGTTKSGSKTGMSGYTIVQADSIEVAIEMARECPFLQLNGELEVSELAQMTG